MTMQNGPLPGASGGRKGARPRHRILMVTDFFYPNVGGVENHIYQLAQQLLLLGHKVVIATHAYGDCRGVRWTSNGLKVYYLHRRNLYQQTTFPTLFIGMVMLRHILLREGITLVHAHQAFSCIGLESVMWARTMGYQCVFTDHSLFGFADSSSIFMNKTLKVALADVSHVICVSNTSKENTVLRTCIPPARVSVIPNAVDMTIFYPARADKTSSQAKGVDPLTPSTPTPPWPRNGLRDPVVIVILCRLVYRKGLDLVALVLPYVCERYPNVTFLVGGGGPKARLIEAVAQAHGLQSRVTMAGPVPSEQAAHFMRQGHIFLNASLTEAFCMAIVEAAACGLMVVSTRVGGVPEVLPPDMVKLADPSAEGLCAALDEALRDVGNVNTEQQHARVARLYSWSRVAERTEAVYDLLSSQGPWPLPPSDHTNSNWRYQPADTDTAQLRLYERHADRSAALEAQWAAAATPWDRRCETPLRPVLFSQWLLWRLCLIVQAGTWAGPLWCVLNVWLHLWWGVLEWLLPADQIEMAPDWPSPITHSD